MVHDNRVIWTITTQKDNTNKKNNNSADNKNDNNTDDINNNNIDDNKHIRMNCFLCSVVKLILKCLKFRLREIVFISL